jgi:hypothetical protein
LKPFPKGDFFATDCISSCAAWLNLAWLPVVMTNKLMATVAQTVPVTVRCVLDLMIDLTVVMVLSPFD